MKNTLTKIIFITVFLSFIFLSNAFAQDFKIDVFDEKQTDKSIGIYVTNTFPCPITLKITFSNVKNLCGTKERTFLVSANTKKKMLFTVKQCDPKKSYSYNYNFKYYYGDLSLSKYDKDFQYTLPYKKGESYEIMQGYFGNFSHQEEHALDFDMPEGTNVCAIRDGVVILLKEDSNVGGADKKFYDDGNYVLVYHNDGTMANYVHFRQNGVVVKLGDNIKQGDVIGYSGNTGFSSAPHLHLDVCLPYVGKKKTISTKFSLKNNKNEVLKVNQKYTKP
jgi:murein DD-endopeptidase MepM/ murein hydrolase activator NlpD